MKKFFESFLRNFILPAVAYVAIWEISTWVVFHGNGGTFSALFCAAITGIILAVLAKSYAPVMLIFACCASYVTSRLRPIAGDFDFSEWGGIPVMLLCLLVYPIVVFVVYSIGFGMKWVADEDEQDNSNSQD